jgi:RNA polymerase sigma factor (sigma-70 family)
LDSKNLHTLERVVVRCLNGEGAAYNELYAQTSKPVYNTLVRLLGNQEDAKDMMQETYISVFKSLESFRFQSNITTWVKRIATNKALNVLKKNQFLIQPIEESNGVENIMFDDDVFEYQYEGVEVARKVEELPEGYRVILSLYLFEDYSHQEIADELGISVSTSKSQYHRGKQKLKELLTIQMQ